MKKNVKAVIACAAVLVVAGGGYAALMLTDDSSDKPAVSSSNEPAAVIPDAVLSFEKADIESVTVTNSSGGYEAIPSGESGADGQPVFTVKGIEDLDVN
ncbi:MAG: hypothetical protein IJX24_01680, partial [Oscillospiraceae bacterium]|nr:hypothetical protein [Oscillospiraceae bacterium]